MRERANCQKKERRPSVSSAAAEAAYQLELPQPVVVRVRTQIKDFGRTIENDRPTPAREIGHPELGTHGLFAKSIDRRPPICLPRHESIRPGPGNVHRRAAILADQLDELAP